MGKTAVMALIIGMVMAQGCCSASPGKLTNPTEAPEHFVKEDTRLLVRTRRGLMRVGVDAGGKRYITPAKYHLLDISADGEVLVLSDSETNLYIVKGHGGEPRQVHAFDERTGAAAVSPDGDLLVVARHADYSLPQSQWEQNVDDTLYLVDTETLEIETLPAKTGERVTSLGFLRSGQAVVVSLMDFSNQKLDLGTRERTPTDETFSPSELANFAQVRPRECDDGRRVEGREFGGDEGIDLIEKDGDKKRLVIVEGRERGFHDHQDTIRSLFFTPSCRYVVFTFKDKVWVADTETRKVGVIAAGSDPSLFPADIVDDVAASETDDAQ